MSHLRPVRLAKPSLSWSTWYTSSLGLRDNQTVIWLCPGRCGNDGSVRCVGTLRCGKLPKQFLRLLCVLPVFVQVFSTRILAWNLLSWFSKTVLRAWPTRAFAKCVELILKVKRSLSLLSHSRGLETGEPQCLLVECHGVGTTRSRAKHCDDSVGEGNRCGCRTHASN